MTYHLNRLNPHLRTLLDRYHAKRAALKAFNQMPLVDGQHRLISPVLWMNKRYIEVDTKPAFFRHPDGSGLASLECDLKHAGYNGLRFVGAVIPDSHHNQTFMRHEDVKQLGWYTNPDGESWSDGEGIVWGVVFQLPARRNTLRFIAGYQVGGDDHVVVDLEHIYEDKAGIPRFKIDINEDCSATKEAARAADDMARHVAEEECEYIQRQREEEGED